MRVYIAGPMTGYEDWNFSAFNKAADDLKNLGLEVINPVDINGTNTDWLQCMKNDIRALIDCDAIYMLEGWEKSKGAYLEHTIATTLGLIRIYDGLENVRGTEGTDVATG